MKIITPIELVAILVNKIPGRYIVKSNGKFIWELGTSYKKDVAKRLGYYPIHLMDCMGGPILVGKNDIGIIGVGAENCDWILDCKERFKAHGCVAEGNDLMFNGYKVSGSTDRCVFDDTFIQAMSVSIDDLYYDIRKVCTKPMEKVPGSLPFSQNEVIGWLE